LDGAERGAPTRREQRAQRKAEEILLAAREVFRVHGFSGATTDMIQAQAGVSKATLYSYFPTKEILFQEVCRLKSEAFEAMLAGAVTDEVDPQRFLTRFGIEFLNYLFSEDGNAFFRLMIAEVSRFPQLGRAFYGSGVEATARMIERFLAKAHKEGRLAAPDPKIAAEHFMGMLRGDLHLRVALNVVARPSEDDVALYVEATVARFLKAYAR
jgi:AcrR family transcriptional regulator